MIVDLFAGPGGWDEGLKALGRTDVLGIELDAQACATARAAGHARLEANIAALNPLSYPCSGLIASPPCPSFSAAGAGLGRLDIPAILALASDLAQGRDTRADAPMRDARSLLTIEPLRWALALRPEWLAFEQVPGVLPVWEAFATILRSAGYSVATGILSAEEYGVPQTRRRAYLVASRVHEVALPEPTHQAYNSRTRGPKRGTEHRLPYVTMADALGWGATARPSMTVTGGGTDTGGSEPFGNAARKGLERERDAGAWKFRPDAMAKATTRSATLPAPTIKGGHTVNDRLWVHRDGSSVRVQLYEAAVLQTFPADYPWQGTKGQQHQQIGNAVPPVMAAVVAQAAMSGI